MPPNFLLAPKGAVNQKRLKNTALDSRVTNFTGKGKGRIQIFYLQFLNNLKKSTLHLNISTFSANLWSLFLDHIWSISTFQREY